MYIDQKQIEEWMHHIHKVATVHGWHEEKHSPEHWLGLVMTEVAEAVEADRKNKRANMPMFEKESQTPQPINRKKDHWKFCFELFIKNSIEDEFADVIIRLLDMAYELYGESMNFDSLNCFGGVYFKRDQSFIENAWIFTRHQLGQSPYDIKKSIQFMLDWSDYLKIDIYKHIELKMKYNELREYKHGNKKY